MKFLARFALLVGLVLTSSTAQAQDPNSTEEKAAGKPFYGYAGWAGLAFGALYGACRASRR
jgi:hypothetical protein